MDNSRSRFSPPLVGGSSLLVIFAVLCLTIFALLGLSTVQADGRLADAAVEAVTDYYAADCQAEEIFVRLRSGETPAGVITAEDGLFSYSCPISDTQSLQVELREADGRWTVLRWQAVYTADWDPDTMLELWDGDPVTELGVSQGGLPWQN